MVFFLSPGSLSLLGVTQISRVLKSLLDVFVLVLVFLSLRLRGNTLGPAEQSSDGGRFVLRRADVVFRL